MPNQFFKQATNNSPSEKSFLRGASKAADHSAPIKITFEKATLREAGKNSLPSSFKWLTANIGPQFAPGRSDENYPRARGLLFDMAISFRANSISGMYHSACRYTGNYVKMPVEYSQLPLLERKDSHPVFLYNFVEAIDGLVNYDEVAEEFPGLSYSQINGAFGFLRRLAQFNIAGLDVDDVIERQFAHDEELIMNLRRTLKQGEGKHVLTPG